VFEEVDCVHLIRDGGSCAGCWKHDYEVRKRRRMYWMVGRPL